MINIQERTNRVLNIIKAKYNLTDKSDAIDLMAKHYEVEFLEPQLRPEYAKQLKGISKQKHLSFNSISGLRKHINRS